MIKLLLGFVFALVVFGQNIDYRTQIRNKPIASGTAAPSSASCDATNEVGTFYVRTDDPATNPYRVYACIKIDASTFAWAHIGWRAGTTAPATCSVGDTFFDSDATAGLNWFGCTATNTWTLLSGSAVGALLAANNLSDVASAATSRTNLGLAIGTNVQAFDADLSTYAGITPSANVQSILSAADYAAIRTLLALTIGVNVQAFDADLSTYAGISPSANVQSILGSADFATMRAFLTALDQVAENATDNILLKSVGTSGRRVEATGISVDDSNNFSTPGSVSAGVGGSVAGGFQATQGTLPTPAANTIVINAPTSVATAYQFTMPGAAATGFRFGTNSSNVVTESFVAAAVASEVTTGTDTSKPITPNALADSTIFGVKTVEVEVFPAGTAAATGDGKAYFYVPASINGMNLISIIGQVYTVGTTNTLNVDIARCATVATGNVCSGTVVDVLSTNLTIDSNEDDSGTAAAAAVIDTSNDDVATGQVYRIDVDAIHTTPSQGLLVILTFQLP